MPKVSEELTSARREEIVNACARLYETMNFKDITIKEIGAATSFTRTSIYNYFQTREEIFLTLLGREYDEWSEELTALRDSRKTMSRTEFAETLAHSLENRERMLKLLSMNHYDMESSSRMENLVEFKKSYGNVMQQVKLCMEKFFPEMSEKEIQEFIYAFFPFLFGIYPYTFVTEKQHEAMKQAGVEYRKFSLYELTCTCVRKLLGV